LKSRFRKLVCPFGVVIAGTELFPWSNIHFIAKPIVLELDPQKTGSIEPGTAYDVLRNELSAKSSGTILGGGVSKKDEATCPNLSLSGVWTCISLELYKGKEVKGRRLNLEIDWETKLKLKIVDTEYDKFIMRGVENAKIED